MLTREQILTAKDSKILKVSVPEWGGDVCIKSMTSLQRDKFEQTAVGKNLNGIRALMIAWCVCDENGVNLFSESDVAALNDKSASATQRIFDKCYEMANFSESDLADLEKKP